MTIYIDSDYKCYTAPAVGRVAVETDVFEGKCKTLIEGMRFVPAGAVWTREDGKQFHGEMVSPWQDSQILSAAQEAHEEAAAELQDMKEALNLLGVNANG